MRKYHIWRSNDDYAISDFEKNEIDFSTNKDFTIPFDLHDEIESDGSAKNALKDFLEPIYTSDGIFPIYNSKGETCQQVVNIPQHILTSEEILSYLNGYTILPQETPPWDEIIYKLTCYSDILTDEYYEKERKHYDFESLAAIFNDDRIEEDTDEHYFVCLPKVFEDKKGTIFHLPKPTRAHRTWIILKEYYDYKKNAWIDPIEETIIKRKNQRVMFLDHSIEITRDEIEKAKRDYLNNGGTIKKLEYRSNELDWKSIEIHPLAYLMPRPSSEDQDTLEQSIIEHGFLPDLGKITLYDGKILDGMTRQELCIKHDKKPEYKTLPKGISPRLFVHAMGIPRRHLTSSQKAAYGVLEFLPEFEKEAKKRQIQGVVTQMSQGQNGRASEQVAKLLNISKTYVVSAKSIKENHPEIFDLIFSGDLTITSAKRKITALKPAKKQSRKFETKYKLLVDLLRKNLKTDIRSMEATRKLSALYLKWNRKNDKKMISELDRLESEFPLIFTDKQERHLTLLQG